MTERLRIMYSVASTCGMFGKVILEYQNRGFVYGIENLNDDEIPEFTTFLLQQDIGPAYRERKHTLLRRIQNCGTNTLKKELIKIELKVIYNRKNEGEAQYIKGRTLEDEASAFYQGFMGERRESLPELFIENLKGNTYEKIKEGVISSQLERDLAVKLAEVDAVETDVKRERNYSHRQIAIAYHVLNIPITIENASQVLKQHSQTTSVAKLLQKRISKASDLTKLSGHKTTDTRRLEDLYAAMRLISGKNDKTAKVAISRVITAFKTAYDSQY